MRLSCIAQTANPYDLSYSVPDFRAACTREFCLRECHLRREESEAHRSSTRREIGAEHLTIITRVAYVSNRPLHTEEPAKECKPILIDAVGLAGIGVLPRRHHHPECEESEKIILTYGTAKDGV